MNIKTERYGTTHQVTVEHASPAKIIVIATEINEGFILVGHGLKNLPNNGDKGKIVFERGGPMKGHWKFYPEN